MSKADIMKWQPALSIQTTLQNIVAEEMLIFRTDFFTEQDNYQQFWNSAKLFSTVSPYRPVM